jgi:hypothetical protein
MPLSATLDVRRFAEARITPTGHIIAFTGPSEIAILSVFGTGQPLATPLGLRLFNPETVIPPRPTISNLQWVTGTQVSSDRVASIPPLPFPQIAALPPPLSKLKPS